MKNNKITKKCDDIDVLTNTISYQNLLEYINQKVSIEYYIGKLLFTVHLIITEVHDSYKSQNHFKEEILINAYLKGNILYTPQFINDTVSESLPNEKQNTFCISILNIVSIRQIISE